MGSGKAFSFHETPDTRAKGDAAAFDIILEKVKAAGGEITLDEETPLYDDIGTQEVELGVERVVEFTLSETKMDFQLTRKIETQRIDGIGKHKSLVPMDPPRVKITLKKKPIFGDDWQAVDLEDMF